MAGATLGSSAGHRVIIGGLGHNSSICLAHLNTKTGHLSITDSWAKSAGPSPAFMAWSSTSSSNSSNPNPVRNILIANHAGSNGEAITSLQLYPPYAKRSGSVRTDDPCHIALHPSGRWAATASYDAGTIGVVELMPAPEAAAVEVSQTLPAAAALLAEQQQQQGADPGTAEAAAAAGVFLPAELLLGSVTTYPTEVIGAAAHEAKFSPDGSFLYVPCLKSDWVRMFKFNADTGKLTPNSYPAAAAAAAGASQPAAGSDARSSSVSSSSGGDNRVRLVPGSGPRHLAFHPALPVAYVLNELSSTIARFDWDGSSSSSGSGSGLLTADFEQEPDRIVSMLPPGISADPVCVKLGDTSCAELHRPYGGAELALSNDGRFLYASNRGLCQGTPAAGKSSIVTFAVDDATGALTPLDWQCGAGDVQHPRHISLTPDEANAFVLVANMNSGSVTVFRRDSSSGLLTKVATVLTAGGGVQQPAFVAVL